MPYLFRVGEEVEVDVDVSSQLSPADAEHGDGLSGKALRPARIVQAVDVAADSPMEYSISYDSSESDTVSEHQMRKKPIATNYCAQVTQPCEFWARGHWWPAELISTTVAVEGADGAEAIDAQVTVRPTSRSGADISVSSTAVRPVLRFDESAGRWKRLDKRAQCSNDDPTTTTHGGIWVELAAEHKGVSQSEKRKRGAPTAAGARAKQRKLPEFPDIMV
jgi:hypothetical protein